MPWTSGRRHPEDHRRAGLCLARPISPLKNVLPLAAQSTTPGESHRQAVSLLVDFANHHHTLAATDIQTLLAFIGGLNPKPLSDAAERGRGRGLVQGVWLARAVRHKRRDGHRIADC
jgi:hypothetical protein